MTEQQSAIASTAIASTTVGLEPWLDALHTASKRLRSATDALSDEELRRPSFTGEWSIAQVLSHLGSAAQIGTTVLERGLAGDRTAPTREDMLPLWQHWDALDAPAQRAAWQEADARHLDLLDALDADRRRTLHVPSFAGWISVTAYAGYRLSEQSVHSWDVEVALDPAATIPPRETALLWERLDLVATRFRDAGTLARLRPRRLSLELTGPSRTLLLDLDRELHVRAREAVRPEGTLTGPAESVLRLFYGRNRPQDPVTATGSITLDDLRALFPGY
ncbi:maleylpyruvate isomerase N-terminal domain-containing protein [Streptomyces sp. NBC_01476]|uniref:maleylpyruvate isomerase N-terminal domain-containing protein n=1 Tax=Streptomyces sp. NBC_01476 TaxID=2903881 RepID=UPI002E3686CD|nr:maleylpyruvate isomerase N-terminal domain-containing protein [Streptomyces sp. NBC_01476]